jgi:putative hydroxymethylpyrimidine transport system substrate-binding protein
MKKFILFLVVWLVYSSTALAAGGASHPLTVVLDWFLNPDHAPLLVAEQQGFFKQQGLQVKLVTPADPSDGPKLVAMHKADIAITYQPQLLMQVEHGLPLVRFGSLVGQPLACLVTLKSNHIQRIEELKGKTIGYSSGGIDSVMLETMLKAHGMKLSDVTFINVRYDLIQALLSKNIAAFTGGMRTVEPIQLDQLGHPAQVFYPEDNGFPSYEELIFVTHKKELSDPRLIGFLKAVQEGVAYLVAHPQATWDAVIKQHPELNNPVNKASWMAAIPYFSKNPGALNVTQYQKFAEFMQQQGVIQRAPAVSYYAAQLWE